MLGKKKIQLKMKRNLYSLVVDEENLLAENADETAIGQWFQAVQEYKAKIQYREGNLLF